MSSFVTATWKIFLGLGFFYALSAPASTEFCGQVSLDAADFTATGDEIRVFLIQNTLGQKIQVFTEVDLPLAPDPLGRPSLLRQLRWAKNSGTSICVGGARLLPSNKAQTMLSEGLLGSLFVNSIKNNHSEKADTSELNPRRPTLATEWSLEEDNKFQRPSPDDVKILLK